MLYATSTDGVNWERPALGLVEHNGSTANNLLDFGGDYPMVALPMIHDPDEPDPTRRYKCAFESGRWEQLANAGVLGADLLVHLI